MSKLENWCIITRTGNPFQAPETGTVCMVGEVFGDSRFPDGSRVTTGTLMKLDLENMVMETKRTIYELGEMAEAFETYLYEHEFDLEEYAEAINGKD